METGYQHVGLKDIVNEQDMSVEKFFTFHQKVCRWYLYTVAKEDLSSNS